MFILYKEVLKMAFMARFVSSISACWSPSLQIFHGIEASRLPRVRPASLCLFMMLAICVVGSSAAAQGIPAASEPICIPTSFNDCSGNSGSSGGSDSDPQERQRNIFDRWREHQEERKRAREEAQQNLERKRQEALSMDQSQQQAATQRMLQQSSQSYQADKKERQQRLDDEAQRLQKAFNQARSDAVSSLKDDDRSAPPVSVGSGAASPTPSDGNLQPHPSRSPETECCSGRYRVRHAVLDRKIGVLFVLIIGNFQMLPGAGSSPGCSARHFSKSASFVSGWLGSGWQASTGQTSAQRED
jgi:hypothetical protein